jgi:two-component system response regulator HydG
MTPRRPKERILIVDDSPDTLDILEQNLASRGHEVAVAPGASEALEILAKENFDLILNDMKMPGMNGMDLTRVVRERYPDMEVMMITGYATVESAVEALKTGAEEYLAKPFTDEELFAAVDRVLVKLRARREARAAARGRFGMVGESEGMRRAFVAIERAARQTGPVLILGEAGTGRSAAVRAICAQRVQRSAGPNPAFVFDCGDLSEFQLADISRVLHPAATLYFKNLDRAALPVQESIRRLIEQQPADGARLMFTADPDLPLMAGRGAFQPDLYALLSAGVIALPPLRERANDSILLAEHFVVSLAERVGSHHPEFTTRALRAIRAYPWPGNVEELRAAVTGAALRTRGGTIDLKDFPMPFRDALGGTSERSLAEAETDHILRVLAHAGGHRGRAAEILCIDRKTLREKLKAPGKTRRTKE